MKKNNIYVAPAVETTEVIIESGIATSPNTENNPYDNEDWQ